MHKVKMHKTQMFWTIILFFLAIGYIYFFEYKKILKEGFLEQLDNKKNRIQRQTYETIKSTKDSFVNHVNNSIAKRFL